MKLVATLLAADPDDEMWAWGRDQHVRFGHAVNFTKHWFTAWTSSSRPK